MLSLTDVATRYGTGPEVLHELNLALASGQFVYLMGPTGVGKSSLLRLLGLLQRPSRGDFILWNQNVGRLTSNQRGMLRRRIGIVFQDLRLLDHLSAYDNVVLPLRMNGVHEDAIGEFVPELLSWIGLPAAIDVRPPTLSKGERQLIAVARVIVRRPDLLLCDEPTSNLDSKRARRLMHLLAQLCKGGATVVLATHNDDLVDRYPHPILRMADGHLIGPLPARARKSQAEVTASPSREPEAPQPANERDRPATDTTSSPPLSVPRRVAETASCRKRRLRHRCRMRWQRQSRRKTRDRRSDR